MDASKRTQPVWQRLLKGAAAVGLLVLAFGAWNYYYSPKKWGVVEPDSIYRSGQIATYLIEPTLRKHGIQVIVNLQGDEPESLLQSAEAAAARKLGITTIRCGLIGDGTGDPAQYTAALRAMIDAKRAHKPVLVHCSAGAQRTGGAVAIYRLLVDHQAAAEIIEEMESYGWRRDRDRVLLEYLDEHLPEIAKDLQSSGHIDVLPDEFPRLTPTRVATRN